MRNVSFQDNCLGSHPNEILCDFWHGMISRHTGGNTKEIRTPTRLSNLSFCVKNMYVFIDLCKFGLKPCLPPNFRTLRKSKSNRILSYISIIYDSIPALSLIQDYILDCQRLPSICQDCLINCARIILICNDY